MTAAELAEPLAAGHVELAEPAVASVVAKPDSAAVFVASAVVGKFGAKCESRWIGRDLRTVDEVLAAVH